MQDQARFLTSTGVRAAVIGDGQHRLIHTKEELIEGGLFHIVLGNSESFMDVTDGDPCLQVQLI